MRILTRYLLRSHAGPFLFAVSTLSGLLLINVVAQQFQNLAGKGLSARVIGEVFLLSLPHTLALTIPMGVLVAVLYAFGQLSAENEITALKASGVNVVRLLTPLLVAASLLTVGMVYFMDQVLPDANHDLANLLLDIARKSPTLQLKEQVINEIDTGNRSARYYLQAAHIEPGTNRLQDVAIYDLSDADRFRTIYADSGRMAFNRARTDLYLTLYDGWIHEMDAEQPEQFQRIFYQKQQIRIPGVGNQLERRNDDYRSDREMSMAMLEAEVRRGRTALDSLRTQAEQVSTEAVDKALMGSNGSLLEGQDTSADSFHRLRTVPSRAPDLLTQRVRTQINSVVEQARATESRIDQRRVEWQKKLAIPAACIVFVLIGAPIAIRFPRGGVGMVIAVSLAIFGVYYVGLIGGESLGNQGVITPFWAMWAANVIFLVLGLIGVARLPRVMATSRGGGWDDLWHSLRVVLLRPQRLLRR